MCLTFRAKREHLGQAAGFVGNPGEAADETLSQSLDEKTEKELISSNRNINLKICSEMPRQRTDAVKSQPL
jgi:hypothetical protein